MRELCSLWPTRLLLCGLALVLSAVQVLRIPLDTYGVSDVITSLGSMEVTPMNSIERLFNVACLIVGLLVSALLISRLSAQLIQMQVD